jgi:hypothetical protein
MRFAAYKNELQSYANKRRKPFAWHKWIVFEKNNDGGADNRHGVAYRSQLGVHGGVDATKLGEVGDGGAALPLDHG